MRRGEVWLCLALDKKRPVLILTHDEVIRSRSKVSVAPITTTVRPRYSEVPVDQSEGLREASVVSLDNIMTVVKSSLTERVGSLSAEKMDSVARALNHALGCDEF